MSKHETPTPNSLLAFLVQLAMVAGIFGLFAWRVSRIEGVDKLFDAAKELPPAAWLFLASPLVIVGLSFAIVWRWWGLRYQRAKHKLIKSRLPCMSPCCPGCEQPLSEPYPEKCPNCGRAAPRYLLSEEAERL